MTQKSAARKARDKAKKEKNMSWQELHVLHAQIKQLLSKPFDIIGQLQDVTIRNAIQDKKQITELVNTVVRDITEINTRIDAQHALFANMHHIILNDAEITQCLGIYAELMELMNLFTEVVTPNVRIIAIEVDKAINIIYPQQAKNCINVQLATDSFVPGAAPTI